MKGFMYIIIPERRKPLPFHRNNVHGLATTILITSLSRVFWLHIGLASKIFLLSSTESGWYPSSEKANSSDPLRGYPPTWIVVRCPLRFVRMIPHPVCILLYLVVIIFSHHMYTYYSINSTGPTYVRSQIIQSILILYFFYLLSLPIWIHAELSGFSPSIPKVRSLCLNLSRSMAKQAGSSSSVHSNTQSLKIWWMHRSNVVPKKKRRRSSEEEIRNYRSTTKSNNQTKCRERMKHTFPRS